MDTQGVIAKPATLKELKAMIVSKTVIIPERMKRVARLGMERPELIAFGSAASIAEASGVSPATVCRTATKFGFTSLRDFKELFQNHLRDRAASGGTTFSP